MSLLFVIYLFLSQVSCSESLNFAGYKIKSILWSSTNLANPSFWSFSCHFIRAAQTLLLKENITILSSLLLKQEVILAVVRFKNTTDDYLCFLWLFIKRWNVCECLRKHYLSYLSVAQSSFVVRKPFILCEPRGCTGRLVNTKQNPY